MRILRSIELFVLGPRCQLCGAPIDQPDFWLCSPCACQMLPLQTPCPRCALPQKPYTPCTCQPSPVRAIHANLRYRAPLTTLIHAFKYQHKTHLTDTLATYMWHHPPPFMDQIDAYLPMPLSIKRLHQRGFNQAHLLTQSLQQHIAKPILKASIRRQHRAQTQAHTHPLDRAIRVANSFKCQDDLEGQTLLIIDDVVTTGASMRTLAHTLLSANARCVYGWALARAVP